MKAAKCLRFSLVFLAAAALVGCSGGSQSGGTPPSNQTGNVFTIGTDAALPSVLAFQVSITGATATDGVNTVNLTSSAGSIEFSRLNGLRTLLDLQSVPVGTYTSVTLFFANPVITFLDMSVSPPKISTINGTLTTSSAKVTLPQPLVVSDGDLVGLFIDFKLRDSLQVDGTGQVTGNVTPTLDARAITSDSPDAQIDELRGGVVSVDAANNKFVIQGPHGRHITVVTNAQTTFPSGEDLTAIDTNTIVQVSGSLQKVSLTLTATDVLILTKDKFLLGGLVTDVRPPTGIANQFDMLVRTELPDLTAAPLGSISTISFDGNERFIIHDLHLPIAAFLFNRMEMVAGQRVAVGGIINGTGTSQTLDARRVWLEQQGFECTLVPATASTANGTFQCNASGIAGVIFNGPVPLKIFTSTMTHFGGGLSGIGGLTGPAAIRLRVVGLVLKDPNTGTPVIVARVVEIH